MKPSDSNYNLYTTLLKIIESHREIEKLTDAINDLKDKLQIM